MVVTLSLAVLVVAGRVFVEPSDLYDNEQPLTISYTVDMLLHGHWVVYHGFTGELMTKPPLYNWVAAPFVAAAGYGAEWAHKAPAWLGGLATFVVAVAMGRWVCRRAAGGGGADDAVHAPGVEADVPGPAGRSAGGVPGGGVGAGDVDGGGEGRAESGKRRADRSRRGDGRAGR